MAAELSYWHFYASASGLDRFDCGAGGMVVGAACWLTSWWNSSFSRDSVYLSSDFPDEQEIGKRGTGFAIGRGWAAFAAVGLASFCSKRVERGGIFCFSDFTCGADVNWREAGYGMVWRW